MRRTLSRGLLGRGRSMSKGHSWFSARYAVVLGCFVTLIFTSVALTSWGRGERAARGGPRVRWPEPSWEANSLLGRCRSEWMTRRFTVTSEPVSLRYAQVYLGMLPPIPVPPQLVEQFAGDIMPIVDSDIVLIAANESSPYAGEYDKVPSYEGYVHHFSYGMGSAEDLNSAFAEASVGNKPLRYTIFGEGGAEDGGSSFQRGALPRPYAYAIRSPEYVNVYAHLINLKEGEGGSWDGKYNELTECPCTKQRDIDVERGLIDGLPAGPFECNEALLSEGNPSCGLSTYQGGVFCCHDGFILLDTDKPGNQVDSLPNSTYHMKLTFEYLDCNSPVDWSVGAGDRRTQETAGKRFLDQYVQSAIQLPSTIPSGWYNRYTPRFFVNAAGNLTSYGAQDYNVPQCTPGTPANECVHIVEGLQHIVDSTRVDDFEKEVDLIYARGHLHTGAISIELYHGRTNELLCRSLPSYGEGVAPGDEKGYLVHLSGCQFSHADSSLPTPPRLKLSDPVRVVAKYDSTIARKGVMSLFALGFADPPAGAM